MQAGLVVPDATRASSVDLSALGGDAEAAVRAHTYSLLGALLAAPPDRAFLDLLAAVEVPADTEAEFAECWRVLAMAAAHGDPAAVDDEYHDLFIGLGRGQVVPYGSWYLTGFLMDRPLALLRADLARLGVARRDDVREPEDHAAALCETMAMLCAAGSTADLASQRAFFERHMQPWLPAFMADLQEASSAVFYKAVGRLGARFIDFESRYFAMGV
jgi:TorA maturation chaperone TorD